MDPITIGAVGAGGFAGWRWLKSKFGNPAPPPPGCDAAAESNAVRTAVGSTASGAAAGSAVPGIGTGIGAGAGAGLGILGLATGPCGAVLGKQVSTAVANASKTACAKADLLYAEIKKKGGDVPGWSHLSCDQKLAAALAAASPLGIAIAGINVAVGSALSLTKAGVSAGSRIVSDATSSASSTKVGGGSATVAGVKVSW